LCVSTFEMAKQRREFVAHLIDAIAFV